MIKREAAFQVKFSHFLKAKWFTCGRSGAFELKQCTGDSLPFSDVQYHQLMALLSVKHGKFVYKIPDDSIGIKPFDCVAMRGAWACVVIQYPKFFCLIDVDDFMEEEKRSKRKSLTSARAREIACWVVP